MKKKITNLLLIIATFLVIYTPPIPLINFNILHLVGFISWGIVVLKYTEIEKIVNIHKIIVLYYLIAISFIYLTCVRLIYNQPLLQEMSHIYWILNIIPFILVLSLYYFNNKDPKKIKLIDLFIIVSVIQSIVSIIAFINVDFHKILIQNMVDYGFGDVINQLGSHRLFGFSSNLTFTMPIFQALMAIIGLYLGLIKNKKYLLIVPLLVFSSLINARTPIIILIIGIIFVIIKTKVKFNKLVMFFIIISLVFGFYLAFDHLFQNRSETIDWIIDGFDEIINFFIYGNSEGFFFTYLVDPKTYKVPSGFGWLFGVGTRSLNDSGIGASSDIGLINDIWMGGIIHTIFIYLTIILGIVKSYNEANRNKNEIAKFVILVISFSMVIANIKGIVVYTNELTTLMLIIYVFQKIVYKDKRIRYEE